MTSVAEIEVTLTAIERAAARLAGVAHATPLLESVPLSERLGAPVWLKDETRQRTGSFKFRGAFNAVAALSPAQRGRGLVTASAGNHGLGVATAARLLGAHALIYVPDEAPRIKRDRIAGAGAELRLVPGGYDDGHASAAACAAETGSIFIHAYSDPHVVAGAGTVGLEIAHALPETAAVLVPVGGGGLIGGVGTVFRTLRPEARVIGVQTEETSAMHASLLAGALRTPQMGATLCEGLSGEIDQRSLDLARRVVDEVVLVPEAAVRRAIRWLHTRHGLTVEGSGAVGVAALLEGAIAVPDGPTVVVLSGGNIDAARLAEILSDPA